MKAQSNNIAMWSGPRNISTAMMYSFANRDDCTVWDEPFYAWYLDTTGFEHPMGDEVISSGVSDAAMVIKQCSDEQPNLFYQKHMTQHMLPELDRTWLSNVKNAFLIRSPEKVLASYVQKRQEVTLAEIGYTQQLEIFNLIADQTGKAPPVIDTDKFLANPVKQLQKLCQALDIPYTNKMLSWPAGPKKFDGVWANHWYNAAHKSIRFSKPKAKEINLPDHLQKICDSAQTTYKELRRHSL